MNISNDEIKTRLETIRDNIYLLIYLIGDSNNLVYELKLIIKLIDIEINNL